MRKIGSPDVAHTTDDLGDLVDVDLVARAVAHALMSKLVLLKGAARQAGDAAARCR